VLAQLRTLIVQLALVVAATMLARAVYLDVNFIPRFIMRFQHGFFSDAEFRVLLGIVVVAHALILGAARLLVREGPFAGGRAFARELYLLLACSSVSSLIVFLFTTIFFDPNFFAAAFVSTAALHLIAFVVWYPAHQPAGGRSVLRSGLLPGVVRMAWSPLGLAVVVIAVIPVLLAVQFKRDKDFANSINTLRLYFNTRELEWALIDLVPGLRFQQPIEIGFTPSDPEAFYLLEREGRLFRVTGGPSPRKDLVLDFHERVGEVQVENGALGFALHPRFGKGGAESGYVYAYYTDARDLPPRVRLSRFDLAQPDLAARAASETTLLEQPRNNTGYHNGGGVRFGPDGFLYIGIGDALDRDNHQTISNGLFAGIFRIDVDMQGGPVSHPIPRPLPAGTAQHYMIPSDNPFVGRDGAREEFWALGLRNPFRFAFDPQTGQLWAGDVGDEQFEEVNRIEKGGNYQFPYLEGFLRHAPTPSPVIGTEHPPVLAYAHTAFERAVIGGPVYRGTRFPELAGQYVFADNTSGHVHVIPADGADEPVRRDLARVDLFGHTGIDTVTESPDGNVIVVALGSKTYPTGRVMRLEKRSALAGVKPVSAGDDQHPAATTVEEIKAVWVDNCARCHGLAGRGDAVAAENVKTPDFADRRWQSERGDDELTKAIAKGGAAVGRDPAMPAWEGALTPGEIELMVKLVRSFGAGNAPAR
jgi:glucose/arabinose dehydrogenase